MFYKDIEIKNIMGKCLFPIIFIISCSCSNQPKEIVTGWWTIDSISYNNADIFFNMYSNSIFFQKDGVCLVPETYGLGARSIIKHKWNISKKENKYYISITDNKDVFSKIYLTTFKRNYDKKILQMILLSHDTKIICTKGMFDFDRGQHIIDEI